jgi:hypothetical protein
MPCANTYSYAASATGQSTGECSPGSLVRAQRSEIGRCAQEPSRLVAQPSERHVHLAIDGKALRGTGKQLYGAEEPQKQVLHVYEVQTGIVLQQCPIAAEHNEVSTLKPFLTEALCKGRILTADAAASVITTDGAAGAAGSRGRGPLHQRQYAAHPSGLGTLF